MLALRWGSNRTWRVNPFILIVGLAAMRQFLLSIYEIVRRLNKGEKLASPSTIWGSWLNVLQSHDWMLWENYKLSIQIKSLSFSKMTRRASQFVLTPSLICRCSLRRSRSWPRSSFWASYHNILRMLILTRNLLNLIFAIKNSCKPPLYRSYKHFRLRVLHALVAFKLWWRVCLVWLYSLAKFANQICCTWVVDVWLPCMIIGL